MLVVGWLYYEVPQYYNFRFAIASGLGGERRTLYTTDAMQGSLRSRMAGLLAIWLFFLCSTPYALASAYNGHPKLVVIIVIDQFRGDYLERYRDRFSEGGFRLLLDRGAYFTDCNYDYANTRTAPGHATLLTGAYTNGHGIASNEWWDPQKKRMITSVEDETTHLVGISQNAAGSSPHNLMASTLGDELKLATEGKSRVFGIALKDRAAVLPAGHTGDAAYWIDHDSGTWVTSTYYRSDLPKWAADFNSSNRTSKYWDREWRDSNGKTLRTTAHRKSKSGADAGFYEVVGSTPFANEYEFEFAKELVLYEQLGTGTNTDLLAISLSANDILGHEVGPNAPETEAMAVALDHELTEFFNFLGHQLGLANVWIALSADHGVAPVPAFASKLHLPAAGVDAGSLEQQINKSLSTKFANGKPTEFVKSFSYPLVWINDDAFLTLKVKEDEAERAVGEAMKQVGMVSYFTRSQLAQGAVADTELGHKFLHSYSPEGGWYVMGVPAPFTIGGLKGTDHGTPYTYDTHVPLAFYGLPFQVGTYRTHCEPVDLATTLASLLGINAPTHAVGRVLTEGLASPHHTQNPGPPAEKTPRPAHPAGDLHPASFVPSDGGQR